MQQLQFLRKKDDKTRQEATELCTQTSILQKNHVHSYSLIINGLQSSLPHIPPRRGVMHTMRTRLLKGLQTSKATTTPQACNAIVRYVKLKKITYRP